MRRGVPSDTKALYKALAGDAVCVMAKYGCAAKSNAHQALPGEVELAWASSERVFISLIKIGCLSLLAYDAAYGLEAQRNSIFQRCPETSKVASIIDVSSHAEGK